MDIVHHRIHIDHFHRMAVPYDGHERHELAIPGFDQGDRQLERFACLDPFQKNDRVFQLMLGSDHEIMEQTPASTVRDSPAIGRVGKGNEVEPLRLRHGPIQTDRAFDHPSVRHVDHIVGPGGSLQGQEATKNRRANCRLTTGCSNHRLAHEALLQLEHAGIVPKGATKEKGGGRGLPLPLIRHILRSAGRSILLR